jgi:OCT family organic cation transporter-like MFS transporter 4/5
VYYGISMGANQLAGNPYLNFTLLATNELIAIICTHFAFEKFGRKIPYVINMGLGGLSLLGVLFIPKCNFIIFCFKLN